VTLLRKGNSMPRSLYRNTLGILTQAAFAFALAVTSAFAATTLTVTSTSDGGPGSLRAMVSASLSGDTIVFDCSAAALNCPATITLSSQGNNQGFPGPTAWLSPQRRSPSRPRRAVE